MFVRAETLSNVTFVGHDQQVRHQTWIKNKQTFKWSNACNRIKAHQQNEPVENWCSNDSCRGNEICWTLELKVS